MAVNFFFIILSAWRSSERYKCPGILDKSLSLFKIQCFHLCNGAINSSYLLEIFED